MKGGTHCQNTNTAFQGRACQAVSRPYLVSSNFEKVTNIYIGLISYSFVVTNSKSLDI